MVRKMLKYCSVNGCSGSSRSDPELRFFFFPRNPLRAQQWAEKLGMPCSVEEARSLCRKVVCSRHFSDTDFTTNKRTRLNWTAVPSLHDSFLDLILKPEPFSSSVCLPESPGPTALDCEDELRVLVPTNTYAKTSISPPTFIPVLVPENTDNSSPSLAVPKQEPSLPSVDALSLKDPLSPQVLTRDSNCGRESEGVSLSHSCRSNLETMLKKMEEQLRIEIRLRLKLEGQLLREEQQWMQPKSELDNKKQCCSELEAHLEIERQQRIEVQAQLGIEWQQRNELHAQLGIEQQQRNELQAQLEIEQQQRNELQVQLEIEQQQRNELQAQLGIERQQRNELQAQLGIEQQQRNELQAQLGIERQQRNELQAQLGIERHQRNEFHAQLGIERQQRNEFQAQLGIEQQQRNELQAQLEIEQQQRNELQAQRKVQQRVSELQANLNRSKRIRFKHRWK